MKEFSKNAVVILSLVVLLFTFGGQRSFAGGQTARDSGAGLDEITIQLKWLPQAQFMGYYVAAARGYYEAERLKVNIVPGGGDITEVNAVYSGQVDVGVTWVSNLIVARANGLDLINVAQIYQRSGLVLVAKKESGVASGKDIANATRVGNWMGGNEYEIKALFNVLNGVDNDKPLIQQGFDMNDFDNGNITAASAMTYNELGLVVNNYEGALGYGDRVNIIDMNTEGVAMLEDCMFVKESWARENRDKLVRFIRASLKGWNDACANPDEAAEIVFRAGSSVSAPHQRYMASEVAKLVTVDTKGDPVPLSRLGGFDVDALESTLSKTKSYAGLTDSSKNAVLQALTVNRIYDPSYWEEAAR
jgi:NitT/TauT family transport system substrate-binding protein